MPHPGLLPRSVSGLFATPNGDSRHQTLMAKKHWISPCLESLVRVNIRSLPALEHLLKTCQYLIHSIKYICIYVYTTSCGAMINFPGIQLCFGMGPDGLMLPCDGTEWELGDLEFDFTRHHIQLQYQ